MTGTHNSLTAYPPRNPLFRPFSFLWKCQDDPICLQRLRGVRFFDIRIRFARNGNIRFCHGLVDLEVPYRSLSCLLESLEDGGCAYRIVLERRSRCDEERFRSLLTNLTNRRGLWEAVVKKGWQVLYRAHGMPEIIDFSFVPFRSDRPFVPQLLSFGWLDTIKRWARQNNPDGWHLQGNDRKIFLMDYYNIKNSELCLF